MIKPSHKIFINTKLWSTKYNFSTKSYPAIFKAKSKGPIIIPFSNKVKSETIDDLSVVNTSGVSKHHTPLFKEWYNGIYTFNKETMKILPSYDKSVYSLIKSYLNFYDTSLEKTHLSIRARRRNKRSSINRVIVGKLSYKHTNDKVTVIVYYYDRRIKYYLSKIGIALTWRGMTKWYNRTVNDVKDIVLKFKQIKDEKFNHSNKELLTNNFNKLLLNSFLHETVYKLLEKQFNLIYLSQMIYLQKSKINKPFLLPLVKLLEIMYKKKVNLNFINIKYIYNSASIMSENIAYKLKKNIIPTLVLKSCINMFNTPYLDRISLYDNMYNKKRIVQSKDLEKFFFSDENIFSEEKDFIQSDDFLQSQDYIDTFINTNGINTTYEKDTKNINRTMKLLKNKLTNGIRIEIAGRLTKRNIAQKALYITKYKGNIRDADSSDRGLSTTLLRGFAKSNVEYKLCNSKKRIGSFGVKAWSSGNN